jgi:hypothetical protein
MVDEHTNAAVSAVVAAPGTPTDARAVPPR